MQSKLCTPKFFCNTPPHPGQMPENIEENASALKIWHKKAKKFAQFYLTAFRPEPDLYKDNQPNKYSYEWEDLQEFVNDLKKLEEQMNKLPFNDSGWIT